MATSEDLEGDDWREPDAAVRAWVDPASIVGRTLSEVIVGWHCLGDARSPVLLFLRVDGDWLEACTPGDGSMRLARSSQPSEFDMDEYGRFEMNAADESHPLQGMIGSRVLRVRYLRWREQDVGLALTSDQCSVVIANAGDELFVSTGELPPGYADAVIVH